MDAITRNNIFIENMELINRTMHRHRLLLFALHLDRDDVYQELVLPHCLGHRIFRPQSVQFYQSPYLGKTAVRYFGH